MRHNSLVTAAFVVAVAYAVPVGAFEKGDRCTLRAPLRATLTLKGGAMEATLERGADIEVRGVSEGDNALVKFIAGEAKGIVPAIDLEAACGGTLKLCHLKEDLTLYAESRSDSRSWRIKEGAPVSLLKTGKTWSYARVSDLLGFFRAEDATRGCVADDNSVVNTDDTDPTDDVERGDGPGVGIMSFCAAGDVPQGTADGFAAHLVKRTGVYRPDSAPIEERNACGLDWKSQIDPSVRRASTAGVAYIVVGRLNYDPVAKGQFILELGLVDVRAQKVLKALRARPTAARKDPWAEQVLRDMLPFVPATAGSSVPPPPTATAP